MDRRLVSIASISVFLMGCNFTSPTKDPEQKPAELLVTVVGGGPSPSHSYQVQFGSAAACQVAADRIKATQDAVVRFIPICVSLVGEKISDDDQAKKDRAGF